MKNEMKVKDLMEILRNYKEDDIVNLSIQVGFLYGILADAALVINNKNIMEVHGE